MKNINITVSVPLENIANVLYSCPSGSSYWANCEALGFEKNVRDMFYSNKNIEITDNEEEQDYLLSLEGIEKGLIIMSQKFPKYFTDLMTGDYDNDTADCLLQCSCLDDVVYG